MNQAQGAVLTRLDHSLLYATRRALGRTPAVPVARGLSLFGEHALGWIAVGAAGWASGRRRSEWATGVAGVVAAHAAGVVVKRIVRRVRPDLVDLPALVTTAGHLSFPSAHSCSTAAAAVGYAPLVGRPVMGTALVGMLISRVLLGVHYPTDVTAGALIGVVTARATRDVVRRMAEEAQP
jgi:membrane-associated phospholipid phosphatase